MSDRTTTGLVRIQFEEYGADYLLHDLECWECHERRAVYNEHFQGFQPCDQCMPIRRIRMARDECADVDRANRRVTFMCALALTVVILYGLGLMIGKVWQ